MKTVIAPTKAQLDTIAKALAVAVLAEDISGAEYMDGLAFVADAREAQTVAYFVGDGAR